MSYHDKILLREVSPAKSLKRSDRHATEGGEDGDFTPTAEHVKKRKDSSTEPIESKRRRTLAEVASFKEPAWNGTERGGKATIYTIISDDDEEESKVSEQPASRLKTIAGPMTDDSSAIAPDPGRVSQPMHVAPCVKQSHPPGLQKVFVDIRAHVNSQTGSDGLPIIFSNAEIERYMRALEVAVTKNNSYLFGSMRDMIGEELAKVGLPALPDIRNAH
jgi:hypothetical protein